MDWGDFRAAECKQKLITYSCNCQEGSNLRELQISREEMGQRSATMLEKAVSTISLFHSFPVHTLGNVSIIWPSRQPACKTAWQKPALQGWGFAAKVLILPCLLLIPETVFFPVTQGGFCFITETYWFACWSQCLLHGGQSNLYQCLLKDLLPDSAAVIIVLLSEQAERETSPNVFCLALRRGSASCYPVTGDGWIPNETTSQKSEFPRRLSQLLQAYPKSWVSGISFPSFALYLD